MKFTFGYVQNADFPERNVKDYSHGKYECKQLMRTRKGLPVAVFHHTELDIWKVQYGFSTVFFGPMTMPSSSAGNALKAIPASSGGANDDLAG